MLSSLRKSFLGTRSAITPSFPLLKAWWPRDPRVQLYSFPFTSPNCHRQDLAFYPGPLQLTFLHLPEYILWACPPLLTGLCRLRFALSLAQLRQCGCASEARLKAQQLLKEKFLNWMGFLWLLSCHLVFLASSARPCPRALKGTLRTDQACRAWVSARLSRGLVCSSHSSTSRTETHKSYTELSDPLWAVSGAALPPGKHPHAPGTPGGSPWGWGPGAPPSRMAKASSFSMPAISLSCCAKKAAAGSSSPATPFPRAEPPAGTPNGSNSAMAGSSTAPTFRETPTEQQTRRPAAAAVLAPAIRHKLDEGEGGSGNPAPISGRSRRCWRAEKVITNQRAEVAPELTNQQEERRAPSKTRDSGSTCVEGAEPSQRWVGGSSAWFKVALLDPALGL